MLTVFTDYKNQQLIVIRNVRNKTNSFNQCIFHRLLSSDFLLQLSEIEIIQSYYIIIYKRRKIIMKDDY